MQSVAYKKARSVFLSGLGILLVGLAFMAVEWLLTGAGSGDFNRWVIGIGTQRLIRLVSLLLIGVGSVWAFRGLTKMERAKKENSTISGAPTVANDDAHDSNTKGEVMKKFRLQEAQATFLSGLGIVALGLLVTFAVAQVTSGGFVVVTTGLIVVGGIRTLIGLFQLLGAATLPADSSTWAARNWVPDPLTVGLLNLNVLGLGYLYQSRWGIWALHLGLASFLIFGIVRALDEPIVVLMCLGPLALLLISSAILSNNAAHNEKRARAQLPVRNDPRLRVIAIGLVIVQVLLFLALARWWMLSAG